MSTRHGRSTFVAIVVLVSFWITAAASAGPIHFYGELLTSTAFRGPASNVRAQTDVGFDLNAGRILLDGAITRGAGLGNGYVGRNRSISFTHTFEPAAIVSRILTASLFVATVDDGWMDGRESVAITIDDQFWRRGHATFRMFGGSVSAALVESDGEAVVRVASTRGDVNVLASRLEVTYEATGTPGGGSGASAVPEPGAMALFGAGLGVFGIAKRRRS